MCLFGVPYHKHTRLRAFNGKFPQLQRRCSSMGGRLRCLRTQSEVLEFGGSDTRAAASYPKKLCAMLAKQIARWASERVPAAQARRAATTVEEGRVRRHASRGDTAPAPTRSRQERAAIATPACASRPLWWIVGPTSRRPWRMFERV